jgi:hypothetical protein
MLVDLARSLVPGGEAVGNGPGSNGVATGEEIDKWETLLASIDDDSESPYRD